MWTSCEEVTGSENATLIRQIFAGHAGAPREDIVMLQTLPQLLWSRDRPVIFARGAELATPSNSVRFGNKETTSAKGIHHSPRTIASPNRRRGGTDFCFRAMPLPSKSRATCLIDSPVQGIRPCKTKWFNGIANDA